MALTYTPHLKISWGGALGVPEVEIWSNTVNFVDRFGLVANPEWMQGIANAVAVPVQAWFAAPEALIGAAASLKWLKCVWVQANGRQRDVNTTIHDFPPNVFGTSAEITIWEQSYALTLRTALNRGRSHAGRIFPPLSGNRPDGKSPYMNVGNATVMPERFATCLSAMNAAINAAIPGVATPPASFAASVVSPGDSAKGTSPLTSIITRVVCDRVADIQHRRVNRVPRLETASFTVDSV